MSFDLEGNWLQTEVRDFRTEELPYGISESLNSTYGNWEIEEIKTITDEAHTSYEIEVEKGLKRKNLYFDEDGNRMDKEKI